MDTFDRYMAAFILLMLILIFGGLAVALIIQAVLNPMDAGMFIGACSAVALVVHLIANSSWMKGEAQ